MTTIRSIAIAAMATAMSSLILSPGVHTATAQPADIQTPELHSFRLEPPTAFVEFTDNSEAAAPVWVEVRERDNPDRLIARAETPPVPGAGRVATRSVPGIPAGIPLCASVLSAWHPAAQGARSNTVCTDPAVQAATPDLQLTDIRGQEEREWAVVQNQSPAYLVQLRNAGPDATGIVVDIVTWGVASLGDQSVAPTGWSGSGFTCAPGPTSAQITGALRCTGGTLKQGQAVNPAVIVRFTRPGFGHIRAEVSGVPGETNNGDNGTTLNVRVL